MAKQMKNINLTQRLAHMLEAYCRQVELSESDVVRRAVEEYLKKHDQTFGNLNRTDS